MGWAAKRLFRSPLEGPVELRVRLYFNSKGGDLDNYIKAISDGLNGVAWLDDSQVERIKASMTVNESATERPRYRYGRFRRRFTTEAVAPKARLGSSTADGAAGRTSATAAGIITGKESGASMERPEADGKDPKTTEAPSRSKTRR